jgi:hypothetical protein
MFEIILSPLTILLTLSTSTGVLLHETKVDKIAALSVMAPVVAAHETSDHGAISLESIPHTHVESASFEAASDNLRTQNPSTTPRKEDKKYRLQKKVARGVHAFDSYYLPLEPNR